MDNAKTKSSFDKNKKLEPVYPNGTALVVQEYVTLKEKLVIGKNSGLLCLKDRMALHTMLISMDVNILVVNYF